MRSFLGVASFALAVSLASVAHAQVGSAVPVGAPPDIVRTNDGGMLRGTIVESVPGQYVVISLTTGETRRVEWATVAYAGTATGSEPAIPAPPGAQPVLQPEVRGVALHFESAQPNLTFHRVTGTAQAIAWGYGGSAQVRAFSFERLCTAPCDLTIPPGNYHLALSAGTGDAVPAQIFDLTRAGTLSGHYEDRNAMRIGGYLTIGLGAAGGAALLLAPLAFVDFGAYNFIDQWVPWLIAGGSVLIVAEIVGLILAMQGDAAEIRFD